MARKHSCTPIVALSIVALVSVFCGQPAEQWQLRGWTQTPPLAEPTQTERVVIYTTTPVYTYTPLVKIVTETPSPEYLCVTAIENVNLRPSPGTENYPITPLPFGAKLVDLGGRDEATDGSWAFVSFGRKRGWVNLAYLENCE